MSLRQTVLIVALLNLGYFGIEFAVAHAIASVSLFADSVDFLEDASINLLIFIGLDWSLRRRGQLGTVLAAILLVPAIATIWTTIAKFSSPIVPSPVPLSLTGLGALAVNGTCALLLARFRTDGSLTRAAFLSARNDTLANIAIIAAGLLTAATQSLWPDLVVGLAIAAMNMDAAKEVYDAAREERTAG